MWVIQFISRVLMLFCKPVKYTSYQIAQFSKGELPRIVRNKWVELNYIDNHTISVRNGLTVKFSYNIYYIGLIKEKKEQLNNVIKMVNSRQKQRRERGSRLMKKFTGIQMVKFYHMKDGKIKGGSPLPCFRPESNLPELSIDDFKGITEEKYLEILKKYRFTEMEKIKLGDIKCDKYLFQSLEILDTFEGDEQFCVKIDLTMYDKKQEDLNEAEIVKERTKFYEKELKETPVSFRTEKDEWCYSNDSGFVKFKYHKGFDKNFPCDFQPTTCGDITTEYRFIFNEGTTQRKNWIEILSKLRSKQVLQKAESTLYIPLIPSKDTMLGNRDKVFIDRLKGPFEDELYKKICNEIKEMKDQF